MLILILVLIVGSALVYVSKFNFMPVTVNLGWQTFSNIPLFYVIAGSLVTGLLLAYVMYLIDSIITSFKLRGKDNTIKKTNDEVLELTKKIHQLELENEKLKHTPTVEPEDQNAL